MATELLSGAAGGSTRVGRYFTVVSALPSAVFTAYVYLLVKTGAWGGGVNWAAAVTQFHLGDAALLAIASFAVALALHPLQFALTQVLEGTKPPSTTWHATPTSPPDTHPNPTPARPAGHN